MSSFKTKLLGTILILMLLIFVPFIVLAANEQLQIVSTENGDYLIYVQNLTEEFKYALSTNKDENVATLDFISSVPDDDGNQVVLITNEKYEEIKDENVYIWIENSENQMMINAEQLDFSLAFAKEKMNIVENTTKRILVDTTKTLTSVEDIEGVKTTVTTGAIEITDSKDATYYYMSVKLPADEKYNRLMELSETINQNYNDMDMYSRIQTANEFYNLYNELISNVQWQEVENMTIAQPEDSKNGEQYIVFLRKVEGDMTTLDAQFLTCYEDYNPEFENQERQVSETTKLPITYDSIALIVILAVIAIAIVIVFIRMKKINKKEDK